MDSRIYLLLILVLAFFAVAAYPIIRIRKRNLIVREKKKQLKILHRREAIYLCDGIEMIDNRLTQFYGEPFGSAIRPGMRISDPNGVEYTIKEVYANDENGTTPDLEIPNGMADTAIVIEANYSNFEILGKKLIEEAVVALKVR